MLADELLIDRYRYEWVILKYIENYKNHYCTVSELSTILDISVYKIETYIAEINNQLSTISDDAKILIKKTGEISCFHLDYVTVKKIRLKYVRLCELFNILDYFFLDEIPMKKQVELLHSSQTASYVKFRHLKALLNEEDIAIKQNRITGIELNVRSVLFSTYYELFNGIENPFPEEIRQMTKKISQQLSSHYLLNIPKTKEIKLTLFIGIWLVRLKNGHFIVDQYIDHPENDFTKWLRKTIQSTYQVTDESVAREVAYLMMFCHFEISSEAFITKYLEFPMYKEAVKLTQKFLLFFLKTFHFELKDGNIQNELMDIHVKWLVYHFKNQSFIVKGKFNYFQEVNPNIDKFIKDFFLQLESTNFFQTDSERNKLYYDYLFLLVTKMPMDKIETPLKVCIDFSHGNNYNSYIKMMLQSLQTMNIIYESKISNNTKLFLSDCAVDKLNCEQLIWKKPPTSSDWKELGELLVKLKEKECER
jgi:hypothetical protein